MMAVEKYKEQLIQSNVDIKLAPMYDAILMDFMMPICDGPTATRLIRDLGYKGLILGVTGNALPSDIEHFTSHGADQVLLKPVNYDVLGMALCKLIRS
jgi:CheY-like chemotaxis protein